MQRVRDHGFWRSSIRAVPGILLVGLVTFICYGLGLNLTVTAFFYLIVVVLQSLLGDFVSSAAVSVIADLCLNFFFVPPIFSLRVSDSSDTWALVTFLVTGLVVTRLTTQLRQQAERVTRAKSSRGHVEEFRLAIPCGFRPACRVPIRWDEYRTSQRWRFPRWSCR